MGQADRCQVQVVYALADEQVVLSLEVAQGTTVAEAVAESGLLERFPELRAARAKIGIYGKAVLSNTIVRNGDRVELYRPLIADPKAARARRAARVRQRAG
jgi:uncharacterized protein